MHPIDRFLPTQDESHGIAHFIFRICVSQALPMMDLVAILNFEDVSPSFHRPSVAASSCMEFSSPTASSPRSCTPPTPLDSRDSSLPDTPAAFRGGFARDGFSRTGWESPKFTAIHSPETRLRSFELEHRLRDECGSAYALSSERFRSGSRGNCVNNYEKTANCGKGW